MVVSVNNRGPVIHPGIARMLLKRVDAGQEWNDAWIPLATRTNITVALKTTAFHFVCEEIYKGLDPQQKKIADLQATIFEADQKLAAYLCDNTDETFEELSELDDILSILRDIEP